MKFAITAAALLLCTPAFAQTSEEAERRAKYVKDQVGLTDDQYKQVVELYKQNAEAEKKLESERRDKIRALLTSDEQKTKYDEMIKRLDGGGRGATGGREAGGRDGGRNPMGGMLDRFNDMPKMLKDELGLNDEQTEKVKVIAEDLKKKVEDRFAEARKNNFQEFNWREEMEKLQKTVKEGAEKIREFLSKDQIEKFNKLYEAFEQMGGMGGAFGGRGGDRGGERGGRPTIEERVKRAVEALKIEKADEAAAVKAAIQKVCEAQQALEDADRETKQKVEALHKEAGISEEDIAKKLNEIRDGRKAKDKALKDAQRELNEQVSVKQELELVNRGILR